MAPSLYSPPVHPSYCTGGPERLHLSWFSVGWLVAGVGCILLAREIGETLDLDVTTRLPILSLLTAMAAGVSVTMLTARWLGRRIGTLAGVASMANSFVLLTDETVVMANMVVVAVMTLAMMMFAMANIPGRLRLVEQRWPCWVFFLLVGVSYHLCGPTGPIILIATGVLTLLSMSDSRGLWFFVDPLGWAVLAVSIATCFLLPVAWRMPVAGDWWWPLIASSDQPWLSPATAFGQMVVYALPWSPVAILAVLVSIRAGHYATPFWRLTAIWFLVPLLLMGAGLLRGGPIFALLITPASISAAIGVGAVYVWLRRLYIAAGFAHRHQPGVRWF